MKMQIKNNIFIIFISIITVSMHAKPQLLSTLNALRPQTQNIFTEDFTRAFDHTTAFTTPDVTCPVVTTTAIGTGASRQGKWHPSGRWFAMGANGTVGLGGAIFDFSIAGTALYLQKPENVLNHASSINSVDWHPSGKYLAYAGGLANGITGKVVYFDTETGTKHDLTSAANITLGTNHLEWSRDGKYLLLGVGSALRTFKFDGHSLTELPDTILSSVGLTVAWHPNGNYVTGHNSGNSSSLTSFFYFNKERERYSQLPHFNRTLFDNTTSGIWNPSGSQFLLSGDGDFVSNSLGIDIDASERHMHLYKHTSLGLIIQQKFGFPNMASSQEADFIKSVWSPQGDYMMAAGRRGIVDLKVYAMDNKKFNVVDSATYTPVGTEFFYGDWSPDQQYICWGSNAIPAHFHILRFKEPTAQLLKKTKHQVIKNKKLLVSASAQLPTIFDAVISTSIIVETTLNYSIDSFTTVTSLHVPTITNVSHPNYDWHPSESYLAVSETNNVKLYYFSEDKSTFLLMDTAVTTQPLSTTIPEWGVKWSRSGNFIISGGWRPYLSRFNGYRFEAKSSNYNHLFQEIQWDPSDSYILCCEQRSTPTSTTNDPGVLSLHTVNGTSISAVTSTGAAEYSTQFGINKSGSLVAKGGSQGKINIYSFSPTDTLSFSFITSIDNIPSNSHVLFHPEENIIFATNSSGLVAYRINDNFSTTQLTGCTISNPNILDISFDKTGRYFIVTYSNKFVVYRFTGILLDRLVEYIPSSETLRGARWTPDGRHISVNVISGGLVFVRMLKPRFVSLYDTIPNLLIEISNALTGNSETSTLLMDNSYALMSWSELTIATSNSLASINPLTIDNSNAITGLLVNTSNGAQLLIENSYAALSLSSLAIDNSNIAATFEPLATENSNSIVTYDQLILDNSSALDNLLIDVSNPTAQLLVNCSDALAGLLVDTSNAANATALKIARLNTIDTGISNIHFNSPTITMSYDVFISSDHQLNIHQSGVINGNGHSISFPNGSATAFLVDAAVTTTLENIILKNFNDSAVSLGAGALLIFGNNCRVEISQTQTLSRPWFFAGSALLDAGNNQLTLNQGNEYIAAREETMLTIANASLTNVGLNNIRCINDNASITFANVSCHLTSDLTSSTGAISVVDDLKITGTSIFNFTTTKPLTINAASRLILDHGTSFNYAPASNNRTLLTLTDSTAQLIFNNATLIATATGPQLTKGTLIVDGNMHIQSSAASTAEAIVFGDGTPENDLKIKIMPRSSIKLLSGYLNYENAN